MNIDQSHLQGSTVLSPFLPGTNIQYALDSTSLSYLKTCARLYQYIMIEGWQSREEKIDLRFGIEFHQAMQDYEIFKAADVNHEDAVHDVVQALLIRCRDFDPKKEDYGKAAEYKSKENLVRLVIWYLDHYKNDKAATYIREDGKPAVELSFRFELDWGPEIVKNNITASMITERTQGIFNTKINQPYLLCGHLDKVVNFNGDLYFMDYKTTKTTPGDYFFDQFTPNNQMSLYVFGASVILQSPIQGGIINAIQCSIDYSYMKEHPPFQRGLVYRTKEQVEEWLADLKDWLAKAEGYALANYWPMNDTACDKFGGCRFRQICSKSPQVRERFLESNFEQLAPEDRWNPLKKR